MRVPEYQKNSRINSEEFLEVAGSMTTLEMIYSRVIVLMRKASTLWRKELAPELDAKGIHIITWADCTRDEKENLLDQIKDEEGGREIGFWIFLRLSRRKTTSGSGWERMKRSDESIEW